MFVDIIDVITYPVTGRRTKFKNWVYVFTQLSELTLDKTMFSTIPNIATRTISDIKLGEEISITYRMYEV